MPPLVIQAALVALVVTAAVYDFRFRRIPNWLVLTGFCAGLALNTALGGWAGLRLAAVGFAGAFGLYFFLYMLRAMGAGDVKLMGAVGSLVGWDLWLRVFLAAALTGGVVALVMIIITGRVRRTFWKIGRASCRERV